MTPLVRGRSARLSVAAATAVACGIAVCSAPQAHADNTRLNKSVYQAVYKLQNDAGCAIDIRINPKLRLAAEWQAKDMIDNPSIDGDIGSDGSTAQDRATRAGYNGAAVETVAINPSLAINNLDVIRQWYYRADYYGIMTDCRNVDIGVWSENSLSRSAVVAVYGQGDKP